MSERVITRCEHVPVVLQTMMFVCYVGVNVSSKVQMSLCLC